MGTGGGNQQIYATCSAPCKLGQSQLTSRWAKRTHVQPMSGPSDPAPASDDWLTRFSQFIGRVIPDAMSTAVGMLLLLALGALAIGNSGTAILDAYYRGLWMLLQFTMQMTLILVLSSTLGSTPLFKRLGPAAGPGATPTTTQVLGIGDPCSPPASPMSTGGSDSRWVRSSPLYFARESEARWGRGVDFPFLLAVTLGASRRRWAVRALGQRPAPDEYAGPLSRIDPTGVMPLAHDDLHAGGPDAFVGRVPVVAPGPQLGRSDAPGESGADLELSGQLPAGRSPSLC